jgi:hypothetical protein
MKMIKFLFVLALAWSYTAAIAQWQWIDTDGRKVFSDRAPPPEVLEKSIIKRPANRAKAAQAADAPVDDATPPPKVAASAAPGAGTDKELEAKKKQAADAVAAKRKSEEERIAKAVIESCARAKQAKTNYESGGRIARTNAAGEKIILDDAGRASELKRVQDIIDVDCK